MEQFINIIISELNSSVVVLLAILGVFFLLLFKMGAWNEMFKAHKERIGNVESIKDVVIALSTKVDLIYQNTNPRALIKAQSPISLTDEGKEILKEIDAEGVFKRYSKKLISLVESKSPKNAYDIQQSSFIVVKKDMLDLLKEDDLTKIKATAFTRGVLVEDILSIFGVLLRNQILEDKGIPIADVDKHAVESS